MDSLVVGAGLTGCVAARQLAERGFRVRVLEKRAQPGGNLYDEVDARGFRVQRYGPHAFHTDDPELVAYLSRFGRWVPYTLRCGALLDGTYTPVPFNFTTIDTFYPPEAAAALKGKLLTAFPGRETVPVTGLLSHGDADIRGYGEFLFRKDYRPYTAKQWGCRPEDIDAGVLKRVPVRLSYRDAYFDDRFQLLPADGFSAVIRSLLSHPGISVTTGVDALRHLRVQDGALRLDGRALDCPVIYTGALDELFGCCWGRLPYRSLVFRFAFSDADRLQPAPVVADPLAEGYTRITEFKQLPPQDRPGTSYAVEYPAPYDGTPGSEPCYPVLTEASRAQYARYRALADGIANLTVCGRLGDFRYYNMDQALARALEVGAEIGTGRRGRAHEGQE